MFLLTAGCADVVAGHPVAAGYPPVAAPTTVEPTGDTPPPTTTVRPPVVTPACTVRDLDVSIGAEEGTTGTTYRALVFTNTGGGACTIQGFPGVSFVEGDDGHQVGDAAVREGGKGPVIMLPPGAAATAPVGFRNVGVFDEEVCHPTHVRGLRVYPPHERRAEFVPFETTGCAAAVPGGQLTVRTVHEGTGLG